MIEGMEIFEKKYKEEIDGLMEEFDDVYTGLRFSNVVAVIVSLMERIAKFEKLTGRKKKEIVLHCLKQLISENVKGRQYRIMLLTMVEMTFPNMIDDLISASKGDFIFKIVKKKLFKCCM